MSEYKSWFARVAPAVCIAGVVLCSACDDDTPGPGTVTGTLDGSVLPSADGGLNGDGGLLNGDGGLLNGDGGALNGDGGALNGDGGALNGDGGALNGDGGTTSGSGAFPRSAEAVDVEMVGPYQYTTYEDAALDDAEYLEPIIYYPTNAEPPFASVSFSCGFTEVRSQLEWWGEVLASHGFVVFLVTPTDTANLFHGPSVRADDLVKQVDVLAAENVRSGGPLEGKLALDRLGFSGHSMGGGATLFAADELTTQIRAIVPLQSYEVGGSFPSVTAPALVLAAQDDGIATVSSNARPHYDSLNSEKVFAEVAGAGHMIGTNAGSAAERALQARYAIAWFKLHLEDDTRYETYLYGDKHAETAGEFSTYETAN